MYYNLIASAEESTVLAQYVREERAPYGSYQSEEALERALVSLLKEEGYAYLPIHDEAELIANLRTQLALLNDYDFTDAEWERFFKTSIAPASDGIVEKTRRIQTDYIQNLKRDDGTTKNIRLIDKEHIHNNRLQVINQYAVEGGRDAGEHAAAHANRYDVTILVNGLPLVHLELKRRGVEIRQAFNQIRRYQRDSFWAGAGLYEYVQIFVISNGTNTKYYSNTTRASHIREMDAAGRKASKKTSNSFEFTSYWADAGNRLITDLMDFGRTFLARHTLLALLTRYCIFTTEEVLMLMRPYQIAATERILSRIKISSNYKTWGRIEGGGYIWHTTGSGKTLTSFKTAQLASALPEIDKVLFVVDRKDLDYQTMREYDRFEKGAANGNTSTAVLARQLADDGARIVVTTIQKLSNFIRQNRTHPIYGKHVVLIFDECHRSQFGEMHTAITKAFKKYHVFGFTGTPIFAPNAAGAGKPSARTTPQLFGDKLHTYTIVNAINDGNVLPFRIDYINTMKSKDDVDDKEVRAIDREKALAAPERIRAVTKYILDHFDQKTMRSKAYSLKGQRVLGFNSMFAVASIPACMAYYEELRCQLRETGRSLTIATIFSYAVNEDDPEDALPDEDFNTETLDRTSRDFLDDAIADYNAQFHTNFSTDGDSFQNYYKDLSQRMKKREIDLLIVVNMFLTGFDATTLNTLWVDKNLKYHGLIQAFSRTNRILNSVKTFGNIVAFRNLAKATDDAISLFGDENAESVVLLRGFRDYYDGYDDEKGQHHKGYAELIAELRAKFTVGEQVLGEAAQKDFVRIFGSILRLRNILTAFDDFAEDDPLLPPRDLQDYQSVYLDIHHILTGQENAEKENINDDVVFELELIRQVDINIDYILMLVEKYHAANGADKSIIGVIDRAVGSSPELRSKKELIDGFIATVNTDTRVMEDWRRYVTEEKEKALASIVAEENLKPDETEQFVASTFRDGRLKTTGTAIDAILPPVRRFGGGRAEKKRSVIEKLKAFFEKFMGLVGE
ncbi:type I restriction endonuclease subunit R [uncultured Selenomonas sp.]|uniref:type I restriction endonuclease subunit R n=1 Tax=uncultured Selenomonas sp. TaxID=159275 RepID=UPI0028EA24D5|nr:type I restriction endonuclease subunit R [uncultured Selenomonas sp.]